MGIVWQAYRCEAALEPVDIGRELCCNSYTSFDAMVTAMGLDDAVDDDGDLLVEIDRFIGSAHAALMEDGLKRLLRNCVVQLIADAEFAKRAGATHFGSC